MGDQRKVLGNYEEGCLKGISSVKNPFVSIVYIAFWNNNSWFKMLNKF